VPIHTGTGPGLTARPLGQKSGTESVTLTTSQIPAHHHTGDVTAEHSHDTDSDPGPRDNPSSSTATCVGDSAEHSHTVDGHIHTYDFYVTQTDGTVDVIAFAPTSDDAQCLAPTTRNLKQRASFDGDIPTTANNDYHEEGDVDSVRYENMAGTGSDKSGGNGQGLRGLVGGGADACEDARCYFTESTVSSLSTSGTATSATTGTSSTQTTGTEDTALACEMSVDANFLGVLTSEEPLASADTGSTGGSQPHSNVQPYIAVNYIIALVGIYPSRN